MKNFGSLKMKLLKKITESYIKNNKDELKDILSIIKENKDFKELYLLYEDIENKDIEDIDVAKDYIDQISSLLKTKNLKEGKFGLSGILNELDKELKDIKVEDNNEIYQMLDLLSENDSLLNVDKKISAKKKLINFLTRKKNKEVNENKTSLFTQNQNLLNAVLTNNFNSVFSNSLNEEDKKELKDILSLSDDKINEKIKDLKENIFFKIDSTILESKDNLELITKLNQVKREVSSMKNSKYSYFKLKELKNGLD
jgi:hypothetical protein